MLAIYQYNKHMHTILKKGLNGLLVVRLKWKAPLLQLNQWTPWLLLLRLNQGTSFYLGLQRMSFYSPRDLRMVST